VNGRFSYQNWIDALKAGRTFISNSPLLSFTVNHHEPGSIVRLRSGAGDVVQIHAVAESQLPYDRLEIISNGRAIGEAAPSGPRNRAEIHLEQKLDRSGWFAARAFEKIVGYRGRGVDFTRVHVNQGTLVSNYYGTRRPEAVFAHTSPVYAVLDGQAIRSWEDAQYYIRYLDNAINWLRKEARFARPSDKQASIEAFLSGRAVYERRAREALNR
jgi:hypothetical protein